MDIVIFNNERNAYIPVKSCEKLLKFPDTLRGDVVNNFDSLEHMK